MLKEFREFALRGNLVDLAIGIVIGAAFTGLVNSLVNDLIMPIIGWITGGIDFSNLFWQLAGTSQPTLTAAKEAGATIAYGNFITLVVNFLIVAFVLFMIVKGINRLRRAPPPPAAEALPPPEDIVLLKEIRDLLAKPPAAPKSSRSSAADKG